MDCIWAVSIVLFKPFVSMSTSYFSRALNFALFASAAEISSVTATVERVVSLALVLCGVPAVVLFPEQAQRARASERIRIKAIGFFIFLFLL